MKKIYVFAALAAMLSLFSCKEEGIQVQRTPAINVTTEKLNPATDESGTVRAYAGTQVTAKGLNLDMVGSVKVDGVEATIVSKEMKTLVFEIPVLAKAQKDDPYKVDLEVFEDKTEKLIFKYDYYVTVPVTDAIVSGFAPASGTVGTEVTVSGRNLEQVSAVKFGDAQVPAADFVSIAADAVVVAVPAIPATEADSQLDVAVVWPGGTIAMDNKFAYSIPVFSAYTQAAPALLGDEVVLAGQNLDLVKAVKWGDTALLIADQTAASITIKVPTGLELQNPAVVSKALTAVHGVKEDQTITITSDFKVDTTPVGPAAPEFTSATPADAGYTALFLGREVVVKGQNMASVEKFKVDGVEASLSAEATDIEARFIMPKTITGTAAREVTLIAVWNGGNELDCGKITVYPFYYTKGLRLRIGSNSKSSYPEANREASFLLLDEGRVISVQDWYDTPIDPFAKSGANTVTTAANKVTGAEADYYSVQPYTFAISNSSNKLSFCDPANTANQLKTHYLDGTTALPTTFGTPVMFFAVVTDETLKGAAAGGTLQDIVTGVPKASAGAPACGAAETSSVWVKGSVLTIQYMDYGHASAGTKPGDDLEGVRKVGFLHISDVTCVDGAGAAVATREGYIELDLYWSNVLQ